MKRRGQVGGIYTSSYKSDYKWPPDLPRTVAKVENPVYPDLCGRGEPTEAACQAHLCLCNTQSVLDYAPPDTSYLKGVQTVYSADFDRPVRLQPLRRRFRGPEAGFQSFETPKSHFINPFMLGKEIYRPNLPRTLSDRRRAPVNVEKEPRESQEEPKIWELEAALRFPTELQDRIIRQAMEKAHVDTVMILSEMFREGVGAFDFSKQDATLRVTQLVPTILTHRLCPPPEEIYSLHRSDHK